MHMVECPHCHKKFKVPSVVSNGRMKCGKCQQIFVGSSVETPDEPVVTAPAPDAAAADDPLTALASSAGAPRQPAGQRQPGQPGQPGQQPPPVYVPRKASPVGLIVVCVAAVGVIIGLFLIYYYNTNPTLVVYDKDGIPHNMGKQSKEEANRIEQESERNKRENTVKADIARKPTTEQIDRALKKAGLNDGDPAHMGLDGNSSPGGEAAPSTPAAGTGASDTPGATPQPSKPAPESDSKLDIGAPQVKPNAAGGDEAFLVGRVKSRYEMPLTRVTLTAYSGGSLVSEKVYECLPPDGSISYCLDVPSGVDASTVKVVAKGTPGGAGMVAWMVDSMDVKANPEGDKTVWSGLIHNRTGSAVRDITIWVGYISGDDMEVGQAKGKLAGADVLGDKQGASFRVETDAFKARDNHSKFEVRVFGVKN